MINKYAIAIIGLSTSLGVATYMAIDAVSNMDNACEDVGGILVRQFGDNLCIDREAVIEEY